MPTTPRGYAYPSGSDPTDVPGDLQALAEDVDTDVTAVVAAAVQKALFDANTILKADANDTPEALTVAEERLVGRITGGEITGLTAAQVKTFLALVAGDIPDLSATYVPKSLIDAAGDLIYGSAADTVARLAAGSNGDVLTLAAGLPSWAAASTGAMTKITEQTLGSAAASIDFSSISSSYKSLLLVAMLRGTNASATISPLMRFNGDSGTNYGYLILSATTAAAATQVANQSSGQIGVVHAASADASAASPMIIEIPLYAGTTWRKTWLSRSGAVDEDTTTTTRLDSTTGMWASTAAINQVTLLPSVGNFDTGSYVALYGMS